MTNMSYEDFALPSALPGGSGGAWPALAQYNRRLVHIMPVEREDGVTTQLKQRPHTRLKVDITFFDGPAIAEVVSQNGTVTAQMTPPLGAGQTLQGLYMNQEWFVARLKDRIRQPGFPGIIGVMSETPSGKGSNMRVLADPTPAQVETIRTWFAWKNANPGVGVYTPELAPPVAAPPVTYAAPPVAPQQPVADPWAPSAQAAPPSPAPSGAPRPPWEQ
jgi:hypothetical protein